MDSQPPNHIPNPINPLIEEVDAQKKEVKLLEKMLEVNLGISIILGGAFILAVVLIVAWKFNFADYFQKGKTAMSEASLPQPAVDQPSPKLAVANDTVPLFIAEQVIEPKKIFEAEPLILRLTINNQLKKEVFGFLPYWMLEKEDEINIKLLTSVAYFGLEVDGQGNIMKTDASGKPYEPWVHWQSDPKLDDFIKRAKKNRTKMMVTLKAFDAGNIAKLVQSSENTTNFINNALYLVNSRSLDGINLDFEYIGTPDKKVTDGFSMLVSNLNREMKRQYPKSILTVSTFADAATYARLHDVEVLAQNSDALVIMGYDFHTPNSSSAGPIAPMEGYSISLTGFMSNYLEKVPSEKLILGVGYYGYDWAVGTNEQNGQVSGGTKNAKVLAYAEIADITKKIDFKWDEGGKTPWYSYIDPQTRETRVVHFENTRSLGIKYDFVNQKHLRGIGIWALGFDGRNTDLLQLLADKFTN